jgi:hypothetical protein
MIRDLDRRMDLYEDAELQVSASSGNLCFLPLTHHRSTTLLLPIEHLASPSL